MFDSFLNIRGMLFKVPDALLQSTASFAA